jgi:hypothetical protein
MFTDNIEGFANISGIDQGRSPSSEKDSVGFEPSPVIPARPFDILPKPGKIRAYAPLPAFYWRRSKVAVPALLSAIWNMHVYSDLHKNDYTLLRSDFKAR